MIHSSPLRRVLLVLTGLIFLAIAIHTALFPEKAAAELGYSLIAPNGYSELFAIYFGVWLATAVLSILAFKRVQQPLLGDLVAMFVLAQPVGRLLALVQYGVPQGSMIAFFVLEAVGGLALLLVRPGV